jgi:hypothetical protein
LVLWRALPEGANSQLGTLNLPLSSSPESVRNAWGQGDAGSLLDIAMTWSKFDQLDPNTQYWIVHLWSPGLAIIEVLLIWIKNLTHIPIYFSLLAVTMIIWMLAIKSLMSFAKNLSSKVIIVGVILTFLLSWDFKYIIRDDIFYTEGLGYGLLVIGLANFTYQLIYHDDSRKFRTVYPGVLVGLSIWIRHVSDSGLILLIVFTAIILAVIPDVKNFPRSGKNLKTKSSKNSRIALNKILSLAVIALLVTLPWRAISAVVYNGNPLTMSSAQAGVGEGLWIEKDRHPTYYWLPYNMNWACEVDPIECRKINATNPPLTNREKTKLAVIAALKNPVNYLEVRGLFLKRNWIPNFNSTASIIDRVLSLFPLVMIPILVYFLVRVRTSKKWLIMLVWTPFLTSQLIQLSIIHFESRYFIPVRLYLICIFISIFSLYQSEKGKETLNARATN